MAAYDAIVVGARCAGASLGMLLARRGRRVLVLDRARFPSDTMSTHFLWPRTTAALARWGLLEALAETGCPPIETVTMHAGPVALRGRPEAVDGTSVMYCPRRIVLDKLLVDAARDVGAEVREATLVREIVRDGDRVVGVRAVDAAGGTIEARAALVVGADGLNSSVARRVGAAVARSHPSLTCGFYAYWSGVPVDGVEFFLREGRDILVFPTHTASLACGSAAPTAIGRPIAPTPRRRISRASIPRCSHASGAAGARPRSRARTACPTSIAIAPGRAGRWSAMRPTIAIR